MEVHELKDFMIDKFNTLDQRLDDNFKAIDAKFILSGACVEKLERRVTNHEHWLFFAKGVIALLFAILGWLGFKMHV